MSTDTKPLADAVASALSHRDGWTVRTGRAPSDCACRLETQRLLVESGQRWMQCTSCGSRVRLGEHDGENEATEPADAEQHEASLFGGGQGRDGAEVSGCATRLAMALGLIVAAALVVAAVAAVTGAL